MEKTMIEIHKATADLRNTSEYWSSVSYDEKCKYLSGLIAERKGHRPGPLQILVKELTFPVLAGTGMNTVRKIAEYIGKNLGMDCFQMSIDHNRCLAHLLLDNIDHGHGYSLSFNSCQIKSLQAYVLRTVGIEESGGGESLSRYYLNNEFREDRHVFDLVRREVAKKHLSAKARAVVMDSLDYAELMCRGLCK